MLHAIAIDDEPIALEVIKTLAEKIPFMHIDAGFTNVFDAAGYLQNNQTDLLFLDIKMPDMSGIDFLKSIPNPPMAIFTTAFSEHAVQGFELDAVDYLLKPFSQARFLKACTRAWEQYQLKNTGTALFIKSGTGQVRIDPASLLYVESSGNYMQFVTAESKILSRLTMSEAENLLPRKQFLRVHRSYIINTRQVSKIEKDTVWIGSTPIPVGRNFQQELEKMIR